MYYKEYLEEAIKINLELQKLFNKGLNEVFSIAYLNKISGKIKEFIDIKEVSLDQKVVAYNVGSKIYINKNTFYDNTLNDQVKYLLHEFIHVLQRKRGLFFSKFKEIRVLTKSLEKILKDHSLQPISVFLTGKNQNLGSGGKWEILSYFMNNTIEWNAVDDEGKVLIVREIKSSGIFNINSSFWKKRLPY